MKAPAHVSLLEAILHAKKLRTEMTGMNGCIAMDAISDALVALKRGADEIAPADALALECIADQMHDLASDVAGYYREPELTAHDLAVIRLDERSKAMREDAA